MKLEDVLKNADHIQVRKPVMISLGTKEQCEKMFIEAFHLTDKSFEKFEMLPEYQEVIEWMSDNKGKGLLLTGSVGRGKSNILNGVLPLVFLARLRKILKPIPARELHKHELPKWAICIDDFGQDDTVNDFGTKVYPVEDAISEAEDKLKLLIITSNLSKDQIIQKYGQRTYDRIQRLCRVVIFKGKSFRK